jgi:hypothetical protein
MDTNMTLDTKWPRHVSFDNDDCNDTLSLRNVLQSMS